MAHQEMRGRSPRPSKRECPEQMLNLWAPVDAFGHIWVHALFTGLAEGILYHRNWLDPLNLIEASLSGPIRAGKYLLRHLLNNSHQNLLEELPQPSSSNIKALKWLAKPDVYSLHSMANAFLPTSPSTLPKTEL